LRRLGHGAPSRTGTPTLIVERPGAALSAGPILRSRVSGRRARRREDCGLFRMPGMRSWLAARPKKIATMHKPTAAIASPRASR
jgi:hypothetical protein